MKSVKLAGIAGFCCVVALPAFAAWDSLGSVDVSGRGPGMMMRGNDRDGRMGMRGMDRDNRMGMRGMDRDVRNFDLGGPVERLQLRAERSDIDCRSVMARFGNGERRDIFHGTLQQGRTADIDMPGRARDLDGLVFNCAAMDGRGGTIRISADVGRYRNDWMRGPNWRSTWSRTFNWGSNAVNNWRLVGTESFEGRGDSEQAFTGWRGVNAESVALMPLETDARCARVVARFGNGREQPLSVNNGDLLRRGQYYKLDLPGRSRDLTSLALRCSPVGARRVSIQIFTGR
ncbi:MAG: hypothetical protein JO256_15135 [Alphaproteobacteria bacterium]|nr:hypothetical protein [Alphaproteobacteria bacterium]